MYFTDSEKSIIEPLHILVTNNDNKQFKIILQDNTELIAIFDTCYDTDNNLEIDEKGYEEFQGYAFQVIEVVHRGNEFNRYKGELFEITYHNYPKKIEIID